MIIAWPIRRLACITASGFTFICSMAPASGFSLKRIIISTLAPSLSW
jgi:hypothetical protein